MELARFLHGAPDYRTAGLTIDHGRAYEAFSAVFFGGRRRRVYTALARLSGARPGDRGSPTPASPWASGRRFRPHPA